jgi:hypothetical protein
MKLVNLTPHSIVFRFPGVPDLVIPPSGSICRCDPTSEPAGQADGIPVVRSSFGDFVGLPSPEPGTCYITSTPAAQKAAQMGRTDVVSPDTGPTAIREAGQVKAVIRLQCFGEFRV